MGIGKCKRDILREGGWVENKGIHESGQIESKYDINIVYAYSNSIRFKMCQKFYSKPFIFIKN